MLQDIEIFTWGKESGCVCSLCVFFLLQQVLLVLALFFPYLRLVLFNCPALFTFGACGIFVNHSKMLKLNSYEMLANPRVNYKVYTRTQHRANVSNDSTIIQPMSTDSIVLALIQKPLSISCITRPSCKW